jgi:hypothetical protein
VRYILHTSHEAEKSSSCLTAFLVLYRLMHAGPAPSFGPEEDMAQTSKHAYTTTFLIVSDAIEWEAREGTCTFFQAKVEDRNESGMKLEHTLKFSNEDFQSLNGALAALQAFCQGN